MCAIARPQKGRNDEPNFDGKLGIFLFITKEAVLRGRKNRPKGTLETKAIQSHNQTRNQGGLINQVSSNSLWFLYNYQNLCSSSFSHFIDHRLSQL